MPRIRFPEGRRRTLAIASLVAWCLGPLALQSQELVDTLESAAGVRWNDIWFYPTGGKLFVSDETGESVLVYDANTLASLGSISVSVYAGTPQALAGHDGTGTLYVVSDAGFATSVSDIVIIDADTQMVTGSLPAVEPDDRRRREPRASLRLRGERRRTAVGVRGRDQHAGRQPRSQHRRSDAVRHHWLRRAQPGDRRAAGDRDEGFAINQSAMAW